MRKRITFILIVLLNIIVAAAKSTPSRIATLIPGGEYYFYNTYYNRLLGGNADNSSPALSKQGINDSASYVFVAESSNTAGYYWLRQKSTGKYLQASNATSDTWSVWLAGSLNKTYNSYEWKLGMGTEGYMISHRGETNSGTIKYYLGVDSGRVANTYISVFYNKAFDNKSTWQILEAGRPVDSTRLELYVSELNDTIAEGDSIFNNQAYGKASEKSELAVALYNARSAVETASITQLDLLVKAKEALVDAIKNTKSRSYTIWLSGSSFVTGSSFTVALRGVEMIASDTAKCELVLRNSNKTGAVICLEKHHLKVGSTVISSNLDNVSGKHDYQFAFDGSNVTVYFDSVKIGTAPQYAVPTLTSVGTSAEWTIVGKSALEAYDPVLLSSDKALEAGVLEKNKYGKEECSSLLMVGQTMALDKAVDWHICSGDAPMTDSKINIRNEDVWVIFDNVRPSDVAGSYLNNITVNGSSAVVGQNVRVVIYLQGTAVIPQGDSYQPFEGYTGNMYTGDLYRFGLGKATLGKAANNLQSFILKRGYMACLATNADGSGYSRVYVADHEDQTVSVLPDLLNHRISYIKIRKWNYVSKKGWCSTEATSNINTEGKLLVTSWFYTWGADRSTQTDMEYVPIRSLRYWPGWDALDQDNATAVLSFNEPDHSEQHTTDGGVISNWEACTYTPYFQACGLRIGSPAPTDASYLTDYIGHCNDMGYRCDFVSFHAYWGTNEAANAAAWKSKLQAIYNATKRPIWLTEWNNGASWTTETWPSSYSDKLTQQMNATKAILNVLDNCNFIERYSIYNWDSYYRAMISWDSNTSNWWVTPAGEIYRDDHPTFAYNDTVQFVPVGWFPSVKSHVTFSCILKSSNREFVPTISDPNGDFTGMLTYEYRTADGTYKTFLTENDRSDYDDTLRTHTFSLDNVPAHAMAGDSLTLRAVITTLSGKVVYSNTVSQAVPLYLKTYYTTGITEPENSSSLIVRGLTGAIEIRTPQAGSWDLYQVNGEKVMTVKVQDYKLVGGLNPGVYLLGGKKVLVK